MAIVQTSLIGTKLPNLGALLTLFDMLGIKQTFLSLIMPLAQWALQAAFDLLEKDGFTWEWQPDNWYRDRGQLDQ